MLKVDMAKGTITPTKIVVRIEASRLSSQRRACDGEGKRSSNTDPWRTGSRASVPGRKPSRPEDGIAAEWSRRSGQDGRDRVAPSALFPDRKSTRLNSSH